MIAGKLEFNLRMLETGRSGTRQSVNRQERTREARELLKRAEDEPENGGDERTAAGFLWKAFAHCLLADGHERQSGSTA